MVLACHIKGCRSESYPNCGISFFRLPKNEVLRKAWLNAIPKADLRKGRKHFAVCSNHFHPDDINIHCRTANLMARLRHGAVPSIFNMSTTPQIKISDINHIDNTYERSLSNEDTTEEPGIGLNMIRVTPVNPIPGLPTLFSHLVNRDVIQANVANEQWLSDEDRPLKHSSAANANPKPNVFPHLIKCEEIQDDVTNEQWSSDEDRPLKQSSATNANSELTVFSHLVKREEIQAYVTNEQWLSHEDGAQSPSSAANADSERTVFSQLLTRDVIQANVTNEQWLSDEDRPLKQSSATNTNSESTMLSHLVKREVIQADVTNEQRLSHEDGALNPSSAANADSDPTVCSHLVKREEIQADVTIEQRLSHEDGALNPSSATNADSEPTVFSQLVIRDVNQAKTNEQWPINSAANANPKLTVFNNDAIVNQATMTFSSDSKRCCCMSTRKKLLQCHAKNKQLRRKVKVANKIMKRAKSRLKTMKSELDASLKLNAVLYKKMEALRKKYSRYS